MRHAEGDLAGARAGFDAALADPDAATQTAAVAYLGLLLEHGDRFAEARGLLDRSIEACRAAGLFRPMLTSCFAATLACARDLAARALDLLGPDATGTHPGLHAQLALAECALVAGDRGEAAAVLERAGGQLERPFGYRWRVELRHAELASRLDPPAAEALLGLARTYGSVKYQALALARLGRREEAARVARPSGSDYLLAQVGGPNQARAAVDRIAAALPAELRPRFLERGPLATAIPNR
jgi:tetratricopeptide (TPR) repeat protein